jgi:chemotaxis methyl-accepting protein methylase
VPVSGASQLVVGVGASAGGIEALAQLFGELEPGSGSVFVVITHLDPVRESPLAEALRSSASLPVVEVTADCELTADTIYVPAPGRVLELDGARLRARGLESDSDRRAPIDAFFTSLAASRGEAAAGVVLSGTGADGSLGLQIIAAQGGLTLVQDPDTATHPDMPASAAGSSTLVLAPPAIAARLVGQAEALRRPDRAHRIAALHEEIERWLAEICRILRQRTGHDFHHYKTSTLVRRVARRLQVVGDLDVDAYATRLRDSAEEADALFRTLLIGVTSFFRDPAVFELLGTEILPPLIERGEGPLRIWVPGCATGQEVYSIAILFDELMGKAGRRVPVQIFGTDIDDRALARARAGEYAAAALEPLSAERRRAYFTRHGERYRVDKAIREMCLFSPHNLISDPPFSRLDLISCRNLLIYLGPHLQRKLLPVFHYALRPGGYLLLGPSENLASHTELFRPVASAQRLFQRRDAAATVGLHDLPRVGGIGSTTAQPVGDDDLAVIAQRIVLEEFAPAHLVVNEDGELVHASAGVGTYLELPVGPPTQSVVRLARPGLRSSVRAALVDAVSRRRRAISQSGSLTTSGGVQRVMVTVQPMPAVNADAQLYMIVFQPAAVAVATAAEMGPATTTWWSRIWSASCAPPGSKSSAPCISSRPPTRSSSPPTRSSCR